MRVRNGFFAAALAALALAGHALFAAVPTAMPYQGYLTDNAGQPVNGTFSVVFALYDVPFGGSSLWSETQPTLNIVAGVVSTDLGLSVPLPDSLFGDPLYLGVKVGGDAEMTPRLRFGSVPFARISGGVSCGNGITNCSGVCANLVADPAHCGTCSNACAPATSCTSGVCTCSAGFVNCGPAGCRNLSNDPQYCGACSNNCGANANCTSGACVCFSGFTLCSTGCKNVSTDPQNCGSCGTVCGSGMSCTFGVCT